MGTLMIIVISFIVGACFSALVGWPLWQGALACGIGAGLGLLFAPEV